MKNHPLPKATFTYDKESGAAYIYLAGKIPPAGVARTFDVHRHKGGLGIYLDFAADGTLLGIELLNEANFPEPIKEQAERER